MRQPTYTSAAWLAAGMVLALAASTPTLAQVDGTSTLAEEQDFGTTPTAMDSGDDVVVGGNVVAGNGLAAGSTSGNPEVGELQLHRSQGTAKALRAFENNLSLRTDENSFFPDLSLHTDGGIGIGSGFPTADLDIFDNDGNGFSAFRLTREGDATWAVSHNHATGDMVFNLISSPGPEVVLRDRFHPTATLGIRGAVRATQYKTTSSILRKTAFEAIDPADVLAQLAALPVSAWRYKSEHKGARHIGPFAEDFQRLFGLGDGKTIATVDADGVLIAAVQGLLQKLELDLSTKDEQIATLEKANAELAQRVEALERR